MATTTTDKGIWTLVWTAEHGTHGVIRIERFSYSDAAEDRGWAVVELEDGRVDADDDNDPTVVDHYDSAEDARTDAEEYDRDRHYADLHDRISELLGDIDPDAKAGRAKMDLIAAALGL